MNTLTLYFVSGGSTVEYVPNESFSKNVDNWSRKLADDSSSISDYGSYVINPANAQYSGPIHYPARPHTDQSPSNKGKISLECYHITFVEKHNEKFPFNSKMQDYIQFLNPTHHYK